MEKLRIRLPVRGQQTLENGLVPLILYGHNKLIRMHRLVLVQTRFHLESTEFAGESASNGATADAAQRAAKHLPRRLHVNIVHHAAATLTRHLPIVRGVTIYIRVYRKENNMDYLNESENIYSFVRSHRKANGNSCIDCRNEGRTFCVLFSGKM